MDDDQVFQCYECADGVQIFATEEALITHKWDMIRTSKRKSHMCCHVCKLDHRTFEGLVRHYQLNHPVKQKLNCPGCKATFSRLYQLMHHLDSDACPHILASRVAENRILQVQATNLVAAAAATAAIEGGTENDLLGGVPSENTAGATGQVPTGMAAIDALRSAQLGIFDSSGVTLGDFGRFVGIDPQTAAEAVGYETAAAAAAGVGGAGWGLSVGLGGANLLGQGFRGDEVGPEGQQKVPHSSNAAVKNLMLQRQRQMGVGGIIDTARQDKGKGKEVVDKGKGKAVENQNKGGVGHSNSNGTATEVDAERKASTDAVAMARAVRDFRHGDSKAPDLLTDDLAAVNQRFQGLNVWAGQEMLEAEPTQQEGSVSGGVSLRDRSASASTTGLGHGLSSVFHAKKPGVVGQPAVEGMGRGSFTTLQQGAASQYLQMAPLLTIDHPEHPRFNIFRYKNKINGRFNCPHDICLRAGKNFKTAGSLIGHLRNEDVHSTLRVQCPSCFRFFTSVNALTQHCESQSSRCQFRESDDYLPFLNILTAGVAEVQGRNVDMTLAYNVQPTAAPALLQDEIYQGDNAEQSKVIW
ncbi:hypothetical protein SBRCBS47491_000952 [Sporothrix bragantina]|uniref:C2H2-type domain-containing protein n=1 Tax=Sporothrix bragantina TaxID=671064 RepID=A0ABP0AUQ7_9PEZI